MLARLLAQIATRWSGARIKARPETRTAEEWHSLANQLWIEGNGNGAASAYLSGIRDHPDNPGLRVNASNVLKAIGRIEEARLQLELALQLAPDLPGAWYNLGILLQQTWWLAEAQDAFERALPLEQANGPTKLCWEIIRSTGLVLQKSGQWRRSRAFLHEMALTYPIFAADCEQIALFTWIEDPISTPEEKRDALVGWGARYADPLLPHHMHFSNSTSAGRPLRVGFVSGDFRAHAVSYFFEPLLKHHDTSRLQVHCYDNSPQSDLVTERLKKLVVSWYPVAALSDGELAKKIRHDEIDILFDLSGHTAYNRLYAFARKAAPIQITWLGFRLTIGMAAIDYRISDNHVDPQGSADAWYRERILRLPGSLWCYGAPSDAPTVSPLPMLAGKGLTLGSFNQTDKLTDEVLEVWAKILRSIPGSSLTMVGIPHGKFRDAFYEKWKILGIDSERLNLIGYVKRQRFFELHNAVDIALDPFPYNGGTTTCESLWMGVPVLALAGNTSEGRAGVSLLSAAGLTDWIAGNQKDYVQIAVENATNPDRLAGLRSTMRERLLSSQLMDGAGFARNFASALEWAWRDWCAQQDR